ncbi:MAG: hypothetical protein R2705_23190 [Ilumatobacteraceae bacterium]
MSVKIGNDNDRTLDGALRALAGEPTTLTPGTAIGILAEHAVSDDDARATTKATNGLVSALAKHPTHKSGSGPRPHSRRCRRPLRSVPCARPSTEPMTGRCCPPRHTPSPVSEPGRIWLGSPEDPRGPAGSRANAGRSVAARLQLPHRGGSGPVRPPASG